MEGLEKTAKSMYVLELMTCESVLVNDHCATRQDLVWKSASMTPSTDSGEAAELQRC